VFATHNSSFKNIIRKLIDDEVELSQIKMLFKDKFNIVDIVSDYRDDQVWSRWEGKNYSMNFTDEYKHIPDFGEIVKRLSNYNNI
jgi:hypothetical protein